MKPSFNYITLSSYGLFEKTIKMSYLKQLLTFWISMCYKLLRFKDSPFVLEKLKKNVKYKYLDGKNKQDINSN